jgi:hypothetical protein
LTGITTDFAKQKFKEDYAKFYGIDSKTAQKMDFNKLYQASRDSRGMSVPLNIPSEIKNHPTFSKNTKLFYGEQVSDTKSEYDRNAVKFFGDSQGKAATLGDGFMKVQTSVEVNKNSELYKRNTAQFFGDKFETQSNGSHF